MQYWGAFVQSLLQWNSNKYYIFWVCICSLRCPASKAHEPYFIAICVLSGSTTFFNTISLTERLPNKKLLNTECVMWLSIQHFTEAFLILRRILRDIHAHRSSCKVPAILVMFWWNFNFLDILSKNTRISNFMKFRPVGSELFHAVGRTYMTKLIVAVSQFCECT
jgi:hypothetical protein